MRIHNNKNGFYVDGSEYMTQENNQSKRKKKKSES